MITRRLFNVSFPRSGHHLVESALRGYFGDAYAYCGHYDHCNTTPCPRHGTNFQKNHDLWLDTPQLAGERYLVLFRHPYPALQSYFDLYMEKGWLPAALDTRETWRQWFAAGLRYWQRLVGRWVLAGPEGRYVLSYEDLTADLEGRTAEIVALMAPDRPVDRTRLADVLARASTVRHMPGMNKEEGAKAAPFAARRIERFRYYDAADLAQANAGVAHLPKGGIDVAAMVRSPLAGRPIALAAGNRAVADHPLADPTTDFLVFPGWVELRDFLDTTAKVRLGLRMAMSPTSVNHLLPVITVPAALVDGAVRDYVGLLGGRVIAGRRECRGTDARAVRRAANG